MSNSFERYAAMNLPKRRQQVRVVASEAKAPLVPSASEKEQRDNTAQFQRYRKAVRAESEALLASEHGAHYRVLLSLLRRLTPQLSTELVNYIRSAQWIKRCDADQKFVVLSMIDLCICRARVRAGLPPFDDALPDEPANAFLIIRELITGV